jgi:hypothetical protein
MPTLRTQSDGPEEGRKTDRQTSKQGRDRDGTPRPSRSPANHAMDLTGFLNRAKRASIERQKKIATGR